MSKQMITLSDFVSMTSNMDNEQIAQVQDALRAQGVMVPNISALSKTKKWEVRMPFSKKGK